MIRLKLTDGCIDKIIEDMKTAEVPPVKEFSDKDLLTLYGMGLVLNDSAGEGSCAVDIRDFEEEIKKTGRS